MHADPKKVAARRWKRRLKAAGSLALAALAGAFVACQRGVQNLQEAAAPSISSAPERADGGGGDASVAPVVSVTQSTPDAQVLADVRSDALALPPTRDAGGDAYVVDAKEHRKGLPVPDYIVE